MAKILFAWELGAGLGHLLPVRSMLQCLSAQGNQVFFMVPDLAFAARVLDSIPVTLLQAPVHPTSLSRQIEPMRSFPQILFTHGFGNLIELKAKVNAIRCLIESVKADVVICDHAPLTLLALRSFPDTVKKIQIGVGFTNPADHFPFRDLRPWLHSAGDQLLQDELIVLQNVNDYLVSANLSSLERLGQLFREVDQTFLRTIPELDPYAQWRSHELYIRDTGHSDGVIPIWSMKSGITKKCFVYLRRHPKLPNILKSLKLLPFSMIVFIPDCPPEIVSAFTSESFFISTKPFNTEAVTREADIAILHGGMNMTMSFLLCGVPVVILPIQLEQTLTAIRVAELGIGKHVNLDHPDMIGVVTHEVLETPEFRNNARKLAEKYTEQMSRNILDEVVITTEQ